MPAPSESPSTLVVVRKRSLRRKERERWKTEQTADTLLYICYKSTKSPTFMNVPLNRGVLICHSALCISNLCSGGTSGLSEALQWHLGWQTHRTVHRPIPIKLTFSKNSQEPIHGDDQCYVLGGQSHRCQYYHHGNQASLRDACCSDAGSSCRDTAWVVGGMKRRVKTFNKGKQTNCTCALLVGVIKAHEELWNYVNQLWVGHTYI